MKTTPYAKLLRFLREENNISQVEIAKRLDLSRASYIALEQGTRELTLKEGYKITQLFNITFENLLNNTKPDLQVYKDMIRVVLRTAQQERKVIKKTKLSQILYLADMRHYYENKESISGMPYRKYTFGPAADSYFRLIEEMEIAGEINIMQIARDDYHMYEIKETRSGQRKKTNLTDKKNTLLATITRAWLDATTADISNFINDQTAYRKTLSGDIIDYQLILEEDPHQVS